MDLAKDLRERWLPSPEQRRRAEIVLRRGAKHAFSAQLLLNKEYGFWTADVELVHLGPVFTDRESCLRFLLDKADEHWAAHHVPLTGGYAVHFLDPDGAEQAAMFDDILSQRPRR